jgi:hypothetical protein
MTNNPPKAHDKLEPHEQHQALREAHAAASDLAARLKRLTDSVEGSALLDDLHKQANNMVKALKKATEEVGHSVTEQLKKLRNT